MKPADKTKEFDNWLNGHPMRLTPITKPPPTEEELRKDEAELDARDISRAEKGTR